MKPRIPDRAKNEQATHIARILSPMGVYPASSFLYSGCIYVSTPDLCFSVVPVHEKDEDAPYSEVQWLTAQEIRTYSALMLAVDSEVSCCSFYPYPFDIPLISQQEPISASWAIENISPLLVEQLFEPDKIYPGYNVAVRNSYKLASDIPLPPVAGGRVYDFRDIGIDRTLATQLFDGIHANDSLVIRGLSTLIKASMLTSHYQFFEEAINTLYISLEASYRVVLRKLKEAGNLQPTSADAAAFVHDAFHNVNRLEKYFEEDYESRILSFHPESRFGTFPYPPLIVDDYYSLFSDLLEVFRYLLVGYIHPKHFDKSRSLICST